jgi:hypothetical protein
MLLQGWVQHNYSNNLLLLNNNDDYIEIYPLLTYAQNNCLSSILLLLPIDILLFFR